MHLLMLCRTAGGTVKLTWHSFIPVDHDMHRGLPPGVRETLEKAYIAAVMSMLLPMPITIWRPSVTAFPTCRQTDAQLTYKLKSVGS